MPCCVGTGGELTKQSMVPGPSKPCEHGGTAALTSSPLVVSVQDAVPATNVSADCMGTRDELTKQLIVLGPISLSEHSGPAALTISPPVGPVCDTSGWGTPSDMQKGYTISLTISLLARWTFSFFTYHLSTISESYIYTHYLTQLQIPISQDTSSSTLNLTIIFLHPQEH